MKRLVTVIIVFVCTAFGALPLWGAQQQRAAVTDKARREAALESAARRAYTPPQAGVMPEHDDIPMTWAREDQDWDTPLMQSIYKNPYSYGNNLDNCLPCFEEALDGNPKAMLAVSMYFYLWGEELEELYPNLPPQAYSVEFWREQARRITSPGWVSLRLGDLHGRWPASSQEYYRQGAELGDAEAMYKYYRLAGEQRHYLFRSAALGYAPAAFLLSEELKKQGGDANIALSRRYVWLAALNADEWSLLHSSFSFYNGEFSAPGNGCEQGYLYSILNMRYQYGNAFSAQKPDNLCSLPPATVSRLEAEADEWQAEYDQRLLRHMLRGRYERKDELLAVLEELAPLRDGLNLTRNQPLGAFIQIWPALGGTAARGKPLPWHMGFYSEAPAPFAPDIAPGGPAAGNRHFLFWVYSLVIAAMMLGGGLVLFSVAGNKQRKVKREERPDQ